MYVFLYLKEIVYQHEINKIIITIVRNAKDNNCKESPWYFFKTNSIHNPSPFKLRTAMGKLNNQEKS